MKLHLTFGLGIFTLSAACRIPPPKSGAIDTGDPVPWADVVPVPREAFRQLMVTELGLAVAPERILSLGSRGGALVQDRFKNQAYVLDARYHHDALIYCIHPEEPSRSEPQGSDGRCPEGTAPVARGRLLAPGPLTTVAVDEVTHRVALLSQSGNVAVGSTDPETGDPLSHFSLDVTIALEHPSARLEDAHLGLVSTGFWVAADTTLVSFDTEGALLEEITLPGIALDLLMMGDDPWVATAEGIWTPSEVIAPPAHRLVSGPGGAWRLDTDTQTLTPPDGEPVLVPGATGPMAATRNSIFLATESGVDRVTLDGAVSTVFDTPVVDLAANDADEVLVLLDEQFVAIHVDETAYTEETPLQVWVSTFIERPHNDDDDVPCQGTGGGTYSLASLLGRASHNMDLLQDLPAFTALGLTPSHLRRVDSCNQTAALTAVLDRPRLEAGLLFHEFPLDCMDDPACHREFLAEEYGALTHLGHEATWVSGLSPHDELGVDWVDSLAAIGAPPRYAFFGLSFLDAISHENDLRAKDAWPNDISASGRVWSTDDHPGRTDREGRGWLTILPGNNVPAFNLGACANLFVIECHPLGRGKGTQMNERDIETLDLLLHRALAGTREGGVHSWSFHLPDIGLYDYTSGCSENERVWTGEACAGGLLQSWLFDIHARFALDGLVRWTSPEQVTAP